MCAIVGLCAVACAESEGSLWLDVPGPPDAKTEVLAVRQDGATSVFVFNLADDPITIPSKLDPNARIDLHAFVYAESPAELGLALGPLPTAAEPNQPLPEPAGAFGQVGPPRAQACSTTYESRARDRAASSSPSRSSSSRTSLCPPTRWQSTAPGS